MRPNPAYAAHLHTLAAQWRLLGLMAVAFARQVIALERYDPRRALQNAERLEVWLRFALVTLVGQLGIHHADEDTHAETDDPNLQHLRQIAAALATLAIFIARVRKRLSRRAVPPGLDAYTRAPIRAAAGLTRASGFLDSG